MQAPENKRGGIRSQRDGKYMVTMIVMMNAVVPGNEGIGEKSSYIMPDWKDMKRKAGDPIVK